MSFPIRRPLPAPAPWRAWGLGPRLSALAEGVPRGARVVDIGTDHALLPEALSRSGWVESAVGVDRCPEPLAAARDRLSRSAHHDVELRQGEGLAVAAPGEFDCAVLAGFGAGTMIRVLEAVSLEALGLGRLILQPTAGVPRLRVWLAENGWLRATESLVSEGRRGFTTLVAVADGRPQTISAWEALVGNLDLDHPLLEDWLLAQRDHLSRQGERARDLLEQVETHLESRQETG